MILVRLKYAACVPFFVFYVLSQSLLYLNMYESINIHIPYTYICSMSIAENITNTCKRQQQQNQRIQQKQQKEQKTTLIIIIKTSSSQKANGESAKPKICLWCYRPKRISKVPPTLLFQCLKIEEERRAERARASLFPLYISTYTSTASHIYKCICMWFSIICIMFFYAIINKETITYWIN